MIVLKLGMKSSEIKKLQAGLNKLGFSAGSEDGIFGSKTEDAVIRYQIVNAIYADGIVGNVTATHYNNSLYSMLATGDMSFGQYLLQTQSDTPAIITSNTLNTHMKLISVDVDTLGCKGYKTMRMREDVVDDFTRLRDECRRLGGGVTSAGCTRSLDTESSASRSQTSLHYCGIAWDLSLDSGMQNINNPYIVTDSGDRNWNVWMKCTDASVPLVTLNAVLCSGSTFGTSLKVKEVSGSYVNFTDMAAKQGFRPIRARKSFMTGGSYAGAEWWHFQHESHMIPGQTTFGSELLKLYDEKTIKANFKGNWKVVKDVVWKESWF